MILFLLLFLSITITTYNFGFFSWAGIFLALIYYFMLIVSFLGKFSQQLILTEKISAYLTILLIIIYSLFLFHAGGIYESQILPSVLLRVMTLLVFPLILTYVFVQPQKQARQAGYLSVDKKERIVRFSFLIFSAFLMRILIVFASPTPMIDVFIMLKEGPKMLLRGQNPYLATFSRVYEHVSADYYTYWPSSLLLEVPFVAVFGDPRILLILADLGSALLIYLLGRKSFTAEILTLVYLFRPNSNFIIEQSWLTTLSLFLILLTIYLFEKIKNGALITGFLTALISTTQPYYLLILPYFLYMSQNKKKLIASFLVFFLIIILPFFLWDKQAFFSDTIGFFLRPSKEMKSVPVYLSLNLNNVYYQLFSRELNTGLTITATALMLFFTLYKIKGVAARNLKQNFLFFALILTFTTFYLFNRWTFINYYYFTGGLTIAWLSKIS